MPADLGCFPLSKGDSHVASDSTWQLQGLIDRMLGADDRAPDALIDCAYQRLLRLAQKKLKGFERVRSLADAGDILHGGLPRGKVSGSFLGIKRIPTPF